MNTLFLLMGLLLLAYLGSFLTARGVSGGLASGVEVAALGFVLGPQALDLVGPDDLTAFEPVVQAAIGWLAFGVGLEFGLAGDRRASWSILALASFGSLFTECAVGVAAWFALGWVGVPLPATDRLLVAGGVAVACSQTTRHAIRWTLGVPGAPGSLAATLNAIAHSDDLVPLVALAALFAIGGSQGMHDASALWRAGTVVRNGLAITVGMGLALGAGASILLRSEMRIEDTWAMLFGVALLAIGTGARMGMSTLTTAFFMGLAVSAFCPHGPELRAMVAPTERPVLLPALLLAGARIDLHAVPSLPIIAGAALLARVVATIVLGWLLEIGCQPARRAGPLVGLSLIASGSLAMCIGLSFALRFPGRVGDTVLVVSVLSALLGEFAGPASVRRVLEAAGEFENGRAPAASASSKAMA